MSALNYCSNAERSIGVNVSIGIFALRPVYGYAIA
jgi:hypothetical protein